MTIRIALLASGRGSNVEAIVEAIRRHQLDADPVCIVTNNPEAGVIQIAKHFSIPCHVIPHQGLTREQHEDALIETLTPYDPDYIVLAGYMRLFTKQFIYAFNLPGAYRIVNIHPSLLPAFAGAHGYRDAFNHGVHIAGVTIHFVDEGMDTGPIISQATFRREPEDTFETFQARGLKLEHQLYPQVLQDLAHGRVGLKLDPETDRVMAFRFQESGTLI